jgi:hypothetical protein
MELQIKGKPYAKGLLNLNGFREMLKKHHDFKIILDTCMSFEFNEKREHIPDELLRTIVWGSLDWGSFLENMKNTTLTDVTFDFYSIKYKDWVKYYPGTIDNKGALRFDEKVEEGDMTIFRQNMIKLFDFDIRNFIASLQYTHIDNDGHPIIWSSKKR